MFTNDQTRRLALAAIAGEGHTEYAAHVTGRAFHRAAHYVVGLGSTAPSGASVAVRMGHISAHPSALTSMQALIATVATAAASVGADTLGVWLDSETDLLWIDAGAVFYGENAARAIALYAGELAIWDNANQCEIRL